MTIYQIEGESGFSFPADMPVAVRRILVRAYNRKDRIRLFYGDLESGKSWCEEFDTIGTVGKSTGKVGIPLLIKTRRSWAGCGILGSIVAIQIAPKLFLYKHLNFSVGEWAVHPSDKQEYIADVYHDGEVQARFGSRTRAENYVAFMKGERWAK